MSFPVEAEPAEKEEEDTDQALSRMLDEKVDAYFANRGRGQSAASSSRDGARGNHRNPVRCHFCKKLGHIQKDCWKKKGVYCTLGSNSAVMIQGKLNSLRTEMMIDSGAGPCVLDVRTLERITPKAKVEPTEKSLHGIGTAKVIGTTTIDVKLHPQIENRKQKFLVVQELGVVLLGREFLQKFDSLEISWRQMQLKIDHHTIPGTKVINGGEIDSRLIVA